ncbi:MAG: phosphoribosylformylglycinamidine cyclo-ligase [Archaeoglobaceae archaeon]|nr:phosphoribosylformylglycinamidine cyclo-ligase [Archaeoglobaceae archaeon]MCX8152792.1 phosphoribosylformylglycinamidine cyclo-ligase [Archaeoglobaceae archaeon]MDW8013499.1 phosphoribosylformylglycinamidine cyclo-ligase [Archaeoglobaceae archaeon]
MKFDYAKAGVDIRKADKAKESLIKSLKFVRKGFGEPILMFHYAGVIDVGDFGIAITNDGVGTKVIVARIMKKFDTVGIDCVAMNVNDLLCIGAEPLAMVDYIAIDKPDEFLLSEIAKGLEEGCRISNITLIGGETAIMPDLVNGFDLAGTAIGWVKKDRIITGEKIRPKDIILAIPSSGIHSNGLTLARKVIEANGISYFEKFGEKTLGEELLTPTRIYVEVLKVVKECEVHGLAHITGGGVTKLKRLKNLKFVIDDPLKPQKIFRFIQELGKVDYDEMYRTFNMGMGFMIISPEHEVEKIKKLVEAYEVGYVDEGEGVFVEGLRIDR